MTVTKAVVLGISLVSLTVSSVQAGSMLTLGVSTSPGSMPSSSVNSTSYSQTTTLPGALTLGVVSNGSSLTYQPVSTPTTAVYQAPVYTAPTQSVNLAPVYSAPAAPAVSYTSAPVYDAAINFGNGPFPNANSLTNGNAQAWYNSPAVDKLFGGVPTAAQQSAFDGTVLQRVQQTFSLSGVPITLTDDPNAQAAHTLSVVSGTTNPTLNNAIGMTYLGGNGFHYIDNSATAAQSVDQLEWIVAHNISHELMLAFNVPENYDQTGNYIDARNASFSMMVNPNSTFSPAAVNALLAQNFLNSNSNSNNQGAQLLGPEAVPEPATILLWVTLASAGLVVQCRRNRAGISTSRS